MQQHFKIMVERIESKLQPTEDQIKSAQKNIYALKEEEATWKQHALNPEDLVQFVRSKLRELRHPSIIHPSS